MAESQTPRGSLLPLASTLLVGTVALYMALVAFSNITDFGTNQQFVRHVFAMDTTFKDVKSAHNIHFVKCADCHPKGVPARRNQVASLAR